MTVVDPGGHRPQPDEDEPRGVAHLLVKYIFRGTPPGDWTPVFQTVFICTAPVVIGGGVIAFVVDVVRGGPIGDWRIWALSAAGACACAIVMVLLRRRRRRVSNADDLARALRRRSLPIEPPAPITDEAAKRSDDQHGHDKT